MPKSALITLARKKFHQQLIDSKTLCIIDGKNGLIASNADKSQRSSRDLALHVANQLGAPTAQGKTAGQSAGANFEKAVEDFISSTFPYMETIRPGEWSVENFGSSRRKDHIACHEPYRHLAELTNAVKKHPEIGAVLGNSYIISPDVVVLRESVSDDLLNQNQTVVDSSQGLRSPFRASNADAPKFVHAVVSCKWTMRSDRSQNTRSEALNLIKNRKGRAPHIVSITAEPSMTRIASLALGTGEIDMVYHAALPELEEAVKAVGSDDAKELLQTLTDGNRLRDISDLPLDLSV